MQLATAHAPFTHSMFVFGCAQLVTQFVQCAESLSGFVQVLPQQSQPVGQSVLFAVSLQPGTQAFVTLSQVLPTLQSASTAQPTHSCVERSHFSVGQVPASQATAAHASLESQPTWQEKSAGSQYNPSPQSEVVMHSTHRLNAELHFFVAEKLEQLASLEQSFSSWGVPPVAAGAPPLPLLLVPPRLAPAVLVELVPEVVPPVPAGIMFPASDAAGTL